MPVSYAKLFERMAQKGIKKIDLRNTYKINPKTVDSLVNNRSVTVDTLSNCVNPRLPARGIYGVSRACEGVNKTVGFVNAFSAVPKGRKAGKCPDSVHGMASPFSGRYPRTFGKILAFCFPFWRGQPPTRWIDFKDGFMLCATAKNYRHTGVTAENEKTQAAQSPVCGSLNGLPAFLIT